MNKYDSEASLLNKNENQIISLYKQAIEETDKNGKYQLILFFILAITSFSCCMILTGFPIQKEIPDFICINISEFQDIPKSYNNKKYKIIDKEQCVKKYCTHEINNGHQLLIVDYSSVNNFVTSLNLICDLEEYSGDFTRSIFIGRIFATILFSYVSDTYGRKISFLTLLLFLTLSNFLFLIIRNKFLFLIIGFISNMSMQNYNLAIIISTEFMSNNLYSVFNGVLGSLFAFCGIFSIIIMALFKNFVILIIIHFVLNLIMIYFSFYYLLESPVFYLAIKNYDALEKVLIIISEINCTYENKVKPILDKLKILQNVKNVEYIEKFENNDRIDEYELKQIKNVCEKLKGDEILNKGGISKIGEIKIKLSPIPSPLKLPLNGAKTYFNSFLNFVYSLFRPYLNIFSEEKELKNLIKLLIPFISINFIYYGQLMFIEKLPGNVKLNSFLIFMSELFSPNLAGYLLKTTGRKKVLNIFFGSSILCCLIFPWISNPWIISFLIFSNSFFITCNFVASYVFGAEVFNSKIKTSANGLLILISNSSMIIGDFLMNLLPSPFYLFAIMSALSILSLMNMEETLKNKNEENL